MDDPTKKTHPSYGMISISRVSGRQRLFGSDVTHMHFISIRLKECEVQRQLSQDWYHATKELMDVWMSEAQFTEMITSPNSGEGVPCTIRHVQGDPKYPDVKFGRPLPPQPEVTLNVYKAEAEETVKNIANLADHARKALEAMLHGDDKPTKANLKAILDKVNWLQAEATGNQNFLIKQLQEHMEKVVQRAVTEFESHVTASLAQRGLEHLQATAPKLELQSSNEPLTLEATPNMETETNWIPVNERLPDWVSDWGIHSAVVDTYGTIADHQEPQVLGLCHYNKMHAIPFTSCYSPGLDLHVTHWRPRLK